MTKKLSAPGSPISNFNLMFFNFSNISNYFTDNSSDCSIKVKFGAFKSQYECRFFCKLCILYKNGYNHLISSFSSWFEFLCAIFRVYNVQTQLFDFWVTGHFQWLKICLSSKRIYLKNRILSFLLILSCQAMNLKFSNHWILWIHFIFHRAKINQVSKFCRKQKKRSNLDLFAFLDPSLVRREVIQVE